MELTDITKSDNISERKRKSSVSLKDEMFWQSSKNMYVGLTPTKQLQPYRLFSLPAPSHERGPEKEVGQTLNTDDSLFA